MLEVLREYSLRPGVEHHGIEFHRRRPHIETFNDGPHCIPNPRGEQ